MRPSPPVSALPSHRRSAKLRWPSWLVLVPLACGAKAETEERTSGDSDDDAARSDAGNDAAESTSPDDAENDGASSPSEDSEPDAPSSEPDAPSGEPSADPEPDATSEDPSEGRVVPVDNTLYGNGPPEECASRLPPMLPNCEPLDPATWGVDCDGDGVPGYTANLCDTSQILGPTGMFGVDCDDADPSVEVWVLPDRDGDGVGSGVLAACASENVPEGYAPLQEQGDCDEDDPTIHGYAIENWGDGIDSDCDQLDTPSCIAFAAGREATATIAPNPTCPEGPDIVFGGYVDCWSCCGQLGSIHSYVANAGGGAFLGRIVVRWSIDEAGVETTGEFELPEGLDPYATSLFEIPSGPGRFSVRIELYDQDGNAATDCDPYDPELFFSHQTCPCLL